MATPARLLRAIGRPMGGFRLVRLAYVYGSVLRTRDYKDIDVAVYADPRPPKARAWELRQKLSAALEDAIPKDFLREVDVHILQEMPLVLQHRIISEGVCVYARPKSLKPLYEEEVLNSFLDFQPAYEWLNRQAVQRWMHAPR